MWQIRRHFPKVETSVLQGGAHNEPKWSQPGDGVITQHQQTVYFLQPMQYFNSEMVEREVLLLQSQVRSVRGMECSSSAAALFPWDTDLQPSRCLCMEKGGHPQLTPGHGARPSLLGIECQCISRKPSGRWRCSGLALHPSHPTALCSFLLTYPPCQTMAPMDPTCLTHNPPPCTSIKPVSSQRCFPSPPPGNRALALCSQTPSLILPNHNCNHFFCTHHHPNTVVFFLPPFLPDLSQFPLFWHKINLPPPLNLFS